MINNDLHSTEEDAFEALIEHLKTRKAWLLAKQAQGAIAIEVYWEEQDRWQGVLGLHGLMAETACVLLDHGTLSSVPVGRVEHVVHALIEIVERHLLQTSPASP